MSPHAHSSGSAPRRKESKSIISDDNAARKTKKLHVEGDISAEETPKKRKRPRVELSELQQSVANKDNTFSVSVVATGLTHDARPRHRKRKRKDAKESPDGFLTEASTEKHASKSLETSSQIVAESQEKPLAPALAMVTPKKKKKKAREQADESRQSLVDDIVLVEQDRAPTQRSERKEKKSKSQPSETPLPLPAEDTTISEEPRRKKKKSKSHHDVQTDPAEDTSLSDQAKKALSYAFAQFASPGTWKFNKAKQNWIVRNYWSEVAIPEGHVQLAARYLSGTQGATRENLTKACRDALTSAPVENANESGETAASTEEVTAVGVKETRARQLLEMLEQK